MGVDIDPYVHQSRFSWRIVYALSRRLTVSVLAIKCFFLQLSKSAISHTRMPGSVQHLKSSMANRSSCRRFSHNDATGRLFSSCIYAVYSAAGCRGSPRRAEAGADYLLALGLDAEHPMVPVRLSKGKI
jgi:hypothetical protein